jgi:hypothetical protein
MKIESMFKFIFLNGKLDVKFSKILNDKTTLSFKCDDFKHSKIEM